LCVTYIRLIFEYLIKTKEIMTTFANLKTGTVVTYNDMSNVNMESVILDTVEENFGTYVRILKKETNTITKITAHTEIDGNRWRVIANA
jgi:hypothetical protein